MNRILIIDDDADLCRLLHGFLGRHGFDAEAVTDALTGIEKFRASPYDLIICDYLLGNLTGEDVMHVVRTEFPSARIVFITGRSDVKLAIRLIKNGALDCIMKPIIPDELLSGIKKALLSSEVAIAGKENSSVVHNDMFSGMGHTTAELYRQVSLVAPTDCNVILFGESGTGKEVLARAIHGQSSRSHMPFVAMDCGTLSGDLAGSELFGHVKGSFTGAETDKRGHFELASGGTLFLDEIANLPAQVQSSLLRVLQERTFRRIGGTAEMEADVRIIVATHEDLYQLQKNGRFREDLFHRLNEFTLVLPALRDRGEDIPLLADHFLKQAATELGKKIDGFEKDVRNAFLCYGWPGNLRELRNVIRRAALLSTGTVTADALPEEVARAATSGRPSTMTSQGLKNAARAAEFDAIVRVLKSVGYNKSRAAEILQIDRKTLYNKLRAGNIPFVAPATVQVTDSPAK